MYKSMIGSKWELKRRVLGNLTGEIGYCFAQYPDYDDSDEIGVQVIFPNGKYDGFSAHEQKDFLRYIGFDMRYIAYKFKNVMQVSRDFENGYWEW